LVVLENAWFLKQEFAQGATAGSARSALILATGHAQPRWHPTTLSSCTATRRHGASANFTALLAMNIE
jgi:hypothetical protein